MSFAQRLKDAKAEILYGTKEIGIAEIEELFEDMKQSKCQMCEEEHGYRCCDPQCEWR